MGLRFPDQTSYNCFFVTTTFTDWKEYGRDPIFLDEIARSISFVAKKYNAKISAYVLMLTHIHLLIFIDGNRLSHFMRDMKKYVAQKIAAECGIKENKVWKDRFDRAAIISEVVFRAKLDYIHDNPMRGGLVEKALDWPWSSARDYFSSKSGPIPIWKGWT